MRDSSRGIFAAAALTFTTAAAIMTLASCSKPTTTQVAPNENKPTHSESSPATTPSRSVTPSPTPAPTPKPTPKPIVKVVLKTAKTIYPDAGGTRKIGPGTELKVVAVSGATMTVELNGQTFNVAKSEITEE